MIILAKRISIRLRQLYTFFSITDLGNHLKYAKSLVITSLLSKCYVCTSPSDNMRLNNLFMEWVQVGDIIASRVELQTLSERVITRIGFHDGH